MRKENEMNSKKMMIVRLLSLLVAAVLSASQGMAVLAKTADARSEERRVGKEC